MPVAVAAADRERRQRPVTHRGELADHLPHAFAARAQAQRIDAAGGQRRIVGQQVADLGGHGLDAVEGEQWLRLLAEQRDALRVVLAAELAVVLGPVLRPRGEAARRVGQRQMAVGEQLHFGPRDLQGIELLQAVLQQAAGALHRRHPALQAALQQLAQGMRVVQVERRPGDEGQAALGEQLHRAHVVGLHQQLAVVAQAAQAGQLGGRLDQRQAGQHQLGAGAFAQFAGQAEPVVQRQRTPFGADRFPQVDDVERLGSHLGVEIQQLAAAPVEQHGSQTQFHRLLTARIGDRRRGSSGCLRTAPPGPCASVPARRSGRQHGHPAPHARPV